MSCANRYGKSTLIACLQLWYLFYKKGLDNTDQDYWFKTEYRTANIAPHSALTEPVFKAIHQIMTSAFPIKDKDGKPVSNNCLISWFYIKERTINQPPFKQFFTFNCYIEHRSLGGDQGDSLQGKPYGLITYDEAARSDHLETELSDAILPRLMDWGGVLHMISTPAQDSPSTMYYYSMYQDGLIGINDTYTQTGSIFENTFFTHEQIQAQVDLFANDPLKEQILNGKFIFGGGTLINHEELLDAQDTTLNDGERYMNGHSYVVGVDTAIGNDEMAYIVLDTTQKPFRLVRLIACKGNSKSPQMHLYDFLDLFDSYRRENNIRLLLETWNGESVRFYKDLPPDVQAVTTTYGSWQPSRGVTDNDNPIRPRTNAIKKADLLVEMKKLFAAREIKIPKNSQMLINQLSMYKEDDKNLKTDRVIALALAIYCAVQQEVVEGLEWQPISW